MSESTSQSRSVGTRPTAIDKLVAEALAIENEAAVEAGALGFIARALVQATLPHKQVEGNEFKRTNGHFTLSILAPSTIGLPYGTLPRLLVAWISTEAVRTQNRELVLGESLAEFMRQLDLAPTGGERGNITRLKDQASRLFGCAIWCLYKDDKLRARKGVMLAETTILDPKEMEQLGAYAWWETDTKPLELSYGKPWKSRVRLTQEFFNEITRHPVPVDLRVLKALSRSPLAIDIYCWLTYRMSYLRKPVEIPWPALQAQFGADYDDIKNFRMAFREQLRKVVGVYPDARVEEGQHGLVLRPSRTHIAPRPVDNSVDRESYPRRNGSRAAPAEPSAKPTATRVSEPRPARGKKSTQKR
jgi:hypothetical protein